VRTQWVFPVRRHPARVEVNDEVRVRTAESLQRSCPQWLVMWSAWRRTFTAFACFTREPVIIDEPRADVFLQLIKQVELEASGRRIASP
jgi:hypothetical protein